jgi:membrane-associated phospholipid phosphatase
MTSSKRFTLLLVTLALLCLYFPINHYISGGVSLKTPLDNYIPTLAIFSVPYLLFIPYWVFALAWSSWKMNDSLFRSMMFSVLIVTFISMLCYVLYPTYVQRNLIIGQDWADRLLKSIYSNDNVYNAFPSSHVYLTMLIALFWTRWYPQIRWIMIATVILVVLSTLFTGQHYLVDPLGGIAVAWIGYRLGLFAEQKITSSIPQPAYGYQQKH